MYAARDKIIFLMLNRAATTEWTAPCYKHLSRKFKSCPNVKNWDKKIVLISSLLVTHSLEQNVFGRPAVPQQLLEG